MFTENFFKLLLNLEEGWVVKTVSTDITKGEVSIEIECTLRELEDKETGEMCKIYDHAPERSWCHLYQFEHKMSHINRFFFACMSLKNKTIATAMLIFFV